MSDHQIASVTTGPSDPDVVQLRERLTVDELASPTIGVMVLKHPEAADAMDEWIESDDMWLARVAIIHQLRFKDRTDVDRLFPY